MPVRTVGGLTQNLRNLIEKTRYGQASTDDLHNGLLELERALQLPLTEPEEDS